MRTNLLSRGGARSAIAALFAAIPCLAPPLAAQSTVKTELVASGLHVPVWVGSPPNDHDRLFVVERDSGLVRIVRDGQVLATPFLDIGALAGQGGEQGFLGLAFHPGYATNGRFFVDYTDNSGDTNVVEYAVSSNPDVADPTPVRTIRFQSQPFSNHNGGNLVFGPDGMLYIGLGDGGSGNDPGNRAQDGSTNLGKMLRLDVDLPPPFVPPDNPFVNDGNVNDEIWALGLRNPWRYSFDRANGDLYIGDVGQSAREEIDYQPGTSDGGENYGWRCMEGFQCTGLSGCTCNHPSLTLPIHDYSHAQGCSVIGGFVYRGSAIPALRGHYFFGDFCSARIWSFRVVNGQITDFADRTAELDPPGAASIDEITSFGEDAAGELYVVDAGDGEIYRIASVCDVERHCSSSPNSSGRSARIATRGSAILAAEDLVLLATGAPPSQPAIFFYGPERADAPFGNGRLCVGHGNVGLFRLLPVAQIDATGSASHRVDYDAPPMAGGPGRVTPGSSWSFQLWFRDPAAGGAGFDTSDAIEITFCP